jgi:hypothetical protein
MAPKKPTLKLLQGEVKNIKNGTSLPDAYALSDEFQGSVLIEKQLDEQILNLKE